MKYKEKLLELILDEDENALFNWIDEQPVLDHVDILKEFKELTQELLVNAGNTEMDETFIELEEKIESYQEACLNEQLASLKVDIANTDADRVVDEINNTVNGIREYLRECVETNAPNAVEMRELAYKIIGSEKEHGLYKPENWDWLKD